MGTIEARGELGTIAAGAETGKGRRMVLGPLGFGPRAGRLVAWLGRHRTAGSEAAGGASMLLVLKQLVPA